MNKIFIPGPAGILEIAVHQPDTEPQAIVVVAHPLPTMGGTMENKVVTTLAKVFAELGFAALRFNFRGVGDSSGVYDSGDGEIEDAIAVAKYALREFGNLPLVLAGFSFGGYVQACAAQQLHPQGLVLIAPAVGRFAMPSVLHETLLIHGEQDEIVPLAEVSQWARQQNLPIVVVPDATHFFHGQLGKLREIVRQNYIDNPL